MVPPGATRLLAEALRRGRYLEFPGVGHFVEVEAGPRFAAAVCQFFDEP